MRGKLAAQGITKEFIGALELLANNVSEGGKGQKNKQPQMLHSDR